MKNTLRTFLILAAATFVADARVIRIRTFRELDQRADLIVVAKPVSTQDTPEQIDLPGIGPAFPVVGLSSEFETGFVLKGDPGLKKLVVHHYRDANPQQRMVLNAPAFGSFDPKASTRYLLFLQREPDGRYAPFDQIDPASTSILALRGTEWDKMKLDDFKTWMDAKKWLNERAQSLGSGLSPQLPPFGRGEGSLHEAALNGKLDKAKALLKVNPELVFSRTRYISGTPLHVAAEYGHKDVAQLLLDNKADIEAKADSGSTPLFRAVFGGHKDLVELLVANKAEVNIQEEAVQTPLHVAVESGYTEIAAFLLANKADVNAKDRNGMMPLHIAAVLSHKALVEVLLANKAEINAKDNRGRTPLGLAMSRANSDLLELLRQHGGRE